ncbi:MAG: GlcNAc-PI de-N-acetylase [Arcobacter sp.]|uniref:PIG-L deacetylase family protein n=1 Tax=uncultured Arcobacter sp. TaxID=165434 RepID=UPI000CAD1C27|nr:PIG-L family deacetylase [uncultured Arcobacter sp.]PLY08702.1 MAG: GlcNAc-PI de-N-acetylase [Arcobacter sp.]
MNKVLVIAVHPDDETLGCGGTLLKYKANGDEIHWLICTTIDNKDAYYDKRENEIKTVSKLYNFNSVHNLRFKTMKVDGYSTSELIEQISKIINKVKPNIIYLPFQNDVHSDHRIIFNAAFSCTKTFRYPFIKKVYMMETLSETEFANGDASQSFKANVFVDISDYFKKKCEIIKVFQTELAEHPFPRSIKTIEALAILRGSSANCTYAESFVLLKEIN